MRRYQRHRRKKAGAGQRKLNLKQTRVVTRRYQRHRQKKGGSMQSYMSGRPERVKGLNTKQVGGGAYLNRESKID